MTYNDPMTKLYTDEELLQLVRDAGGTLRIPCHAARGGKQTSEYPAGSGRHTGVSQLKRLCREGLLFGHTRTEAHWDGPEDPRGYEVRGYVIPIPAEEVEANVARDLDYWRECRAREQEPGYRGYPSRETEAEAEARFRSMPRNTHGFGPTGEFRPCRPNKGTLVFWVVSLPEAPDAGA